MSDFIEELVEFMSESNKKTNTDLCVLGGICVLIGIIIGFLISPVKKGVMVNSPSYINTTDTTEKKKKKLFRFWK